VSTKLTLVVLLFIRPGREAEFERFEASATDIMSWSGVDSPMKW
jgi:hypothetical protein